MRPKGEALVQKKNIKWGKINIEKSLEKHCNNSDENVNKKHGKKHLEKNANGKIKLWKTSIKQHGVNKI